MSLTAPETIRNLLDLFKDFKHRLLGPQYSWNQNCGIIMFTDFYVLTILIQIKILPVGLQKLVDSQITSGDCMQMQTQMPGKRN
jgi:hypothetical protein